ncbi:DUF2218 domain-containing protein [Brevundimonas sp. 3P9-tot-E]|uniref:DUF2218 domain-containing protein n=1 Tax=Brevundimonas TaxID=41275 RepID=UPI0034D6413F
MTVASAPAVSDAAFDPTGPVATVEVLTAQASRYMQQLAKHWAHKFEAAFTPENARIVLPMGVCRMQALADRLLVRLEGDVGADMDRFKVVFADHLSRFGHRETLVFDWRSEA